MADSNVLGVVLLARHGDRLGFYQDPNTYTASATTLTALGNVSSQYFRTKQPLRLIPFGHHSNKSFNLVPSYVLSIWIRLHRHTFMG